MKKTSISAVAAASFALSPAAWADFIAAVHPNYTEMPDLLLYVFGAEGTTGTVQNVAGTVNLPYTIDATGMATITLPITTVISEEDTVVDKAVRVTGSGPISGYLLNQFRATTDMSYLLDLPALGNEYRVIGYPGAAFPSRMSVTAVADGTTLTITPAVNLSTGQLAGVPFTVNLSAGQSIAYKVPINADLTGSHIAANQPVAVFSSGDCAYLPVGANYCDHIFQQLPPVNHWASNYVVPETANTGSAGNHVRILAATDGTVVTVNGAVLATLNAGEFAEVPSAQNLYIVASRPVLVAQFLKGTSVTGQNGDPAFTFIPGTNQGLASYAFMAPTGAGAFIDNYVQVAIPTAALGSLQLNGAPVDTSSFVPVGSSGHSAGRIPVSPGAGRLEASVPFVATLAGFRTAESYLTVIGTTYSGGASTPTAPAVARPVPANGPAGLSIMALCLVALGLRRRRS